jgi:dCMP deaminase
VQWTQKPISHGYNGAPRGLPHCTDEGVGCLLGADGSCIRAVHAEFNAIINAAYLGVSTSGCTLVSTHRPCVRVCAPAIVNAGIREVIWSLPYHTDGALEEVLDMFNTAKIIYRMVKGEDGAPYVPKAAGDCTG